jgi:hypothetical protein
MPVDWLMLVGILVAKHGQSLRGAWKFTLGEFFAVVDIESYINARKPDGWDKDKISDFEANLRERGLI